jgi:hypothetical protein
MRLASFLASSVWFPFNMVIPQSFSIEIRHPRSHASNRGWRLHPLKRKGISGSCFQFVLDTVSADLVKLPVQRRDSLGS